MIPGLNLRDGAPSYFDTFGGSPKEIAEYSFLRAIRNACDSTTRSGTLEIAASDVIAKRLGQRSAAGSFFLPREIQTRDMNTGSGSKGGYMVGSSPAGTLIEARQGVSIVERLGIQIIDGLTAHVANARLTSGATGYWSSDEHGTGVSVSTPTFGQTSGVPKNVIARVDVSEQLLRQISPAAEAFVLRELGYALGRAIDVGVAGGTGAAGQPLGIVNVPGIGAASGTTLGWTGITDMINDVSSNNGMRNPAAAGFAGGPDVELLLNRRERAPGNGGFCWDGDVIGSRRALSSSNVPAATLIFGDWSSVVLLVWGGLEIAVNPHQDFNAGLVGLRAMMSCDLLIRYPQSFSVATSIT